MTDHTEEILEEEIFITSIDADGNIIKTPVI
jgi:hypothetical protein